jgi:hypothetical protein
VDLKKFDGTDAYTTGAGVFGGPTTQWNEFSRSGNASNAALTNATGASTSVTVSWTRSGSGAITSSTGAFTALGGSVISTGDVVIGGLTPGLSYDLAVYDNWDGTPSITVGTVTKFFPSNSDDWSVLTEGTHYVLFQPVATGGGTVTFTPNANPSSVVALKTWSAFQIQPTAVPEPSEYAAVAGLALGVFALVRRSRQAAAQN